MAQRHGNIARGLSSNEARALSQTWPTKSCLGPREEWDDYYEPDDGELWDKYYMELADEE